MYVLSRNISYLKSVQSRVFFSSKKKTVYSNIGEKMNLKGRNAVITSGCSMLGSMSAEVLLTQGVNRVVLVDSNNEKGNEIASRLNRTHRRKCVKFINTDSRNLKEIEYAFQEAAKYFDGKFDIIFNNTSDTNDGDWENSIKTNINALVHSTTIGLKYMTVHERGKKGGVILNNSSICGVAPLAGAPVYTASKHFIIGFTRSLAMPFHYNATKVRMLTICSGAIKISRTRLNRFPQLTEDMSYEFVKEVNELPSQNVDSPVNVIVAMIRFANNGAVVVSEGNGAYGINIPSRKNMAVQIFSNGSGYSQLERMKRFKNSICRDLVDIY